MWGRGEYGRLGLGDRAGSSKLRPTKVKALEGHRVVEGSCGGTHTVVVTDEGRCFIWGRCGVCVLWVGGWGGLARACRQQPAHARVPCRGAFGRLGTGVQKDCINPVELKLPGGPERWRVITAAAGGRHTMVLAVPDNGGQLEERKPFAVELPSPPPSTLGRERSWPGNLADDEGEEGASPLDGVSVDGGDDALGGGLGKEVAVGGLASSPSLPSVRSAQQLQLMDDAAMGDDYSGARVAEGSSPERAASPARAAEAALRVHGLRDDSPRDRA